MEGEMSLNWGRIIVPTLWREWAFSGHLIHDGVLFALQTGIESPFGLSAPQSGVVPHTCAPATAPSLPSLTSPPAQLTEINSIPPAVLPETHLSTVKSLVSASLFRTSRESRCRSPCLWPRWSASPPTSRTST